MTVHVMGPDKSLGFVVTEIWVALVVHADGDESVPAVFVPETGMMHPLVAADPKRLDWMERQVREMVRHANRPIRIVRLHTRELVETFHPDGRRERP